MKKLKSQELTERYKIIIISVLLIISCFLTYYFHVVLKLCEVFSHFFYIPIILASIWWKRKGLLVALFLTSLLVFSHIFLREDPITANDYLRSILLIVIALVVAFLSERIARTEKKLRNTSDYLEKLFNYSNAPIIVWNPDLKITRFNRAFEQLTGFNADEVLGQEMQLLFPESTRDESLKKIMDSASGKSQEIVEFPIQCSDSSIRLVILNSANILAENSKTVIATITQGTDITERKKTEDKLKKSEKLYKDTIKFLPLHLGVTDTDGKYIIWNDYSRKMLGYDYDSIIGKKTLKNLLFKPGLTGDIYKNALMDGLVSRRVDFINCSGNKIPARLTVIPTFQKNNEHTGFIELAEDLTLLESNKKKIANLSKELVQSQENERKRLSSELHDEANSVIVSLKYYVNTIKKLVSRKQYNDLEQFLNLISESTNRLASELRRLCFNLYPADIDQTGVLYALNDYVTKIKMHTSLNINTRISEKIEDSDIVTKTTLYRIVQEAITNAIRHSEANDVSISINKKDNLIKLKVADNGIGFDSETSDKHKYGLKGIQDRVGLLNGCLNIKSKPGTGTILDVEIPVK